MFTRGVKSIENILFFGIIAMDSIDYFDKRKKSKKEDADPLEEWKTLKKGKKILETKNDKTLDYQDLIEKKITKIAKS